MRNRKTAVITMIMIAMICLTACGKRQEENPYGNSVAELGDEDAYAFLVMDYDDYVMAVSNQLYDAGEEKQAAVFCDIYYVVDREPRKLGTVMSEGTAYPVSFSEDGIFAASGHSVEKYVISEKEGRLVLEKGIYENFDENGNAAYTCMEDGAEKETTEEEYQELAEEYGASQIIHFSYGASGCMNELRKY